MTKGFLSARAAAFALMAGLALASVGPAAGAPKGHVDPKVSSIVKGDPAALGFDPAKLQAASDGLKADVAAGKIAGALLIVGRHGKVAYEQSFGTQGPGQTTPITDETIFRVFSMTKPIVSVTAMTLVEDGKLDLDAPVSKYLPEYANLRVWKADGTTAPATRPMLVRNLMSHTSGLIYGFIQPTAPLSKVWAEGGENRYDLKARDFARMIAKLPLRTEPGTAWYFSRSTDVLGAVVEVAGGKPLDVLVKERVTGPLGMTDTAFWQPEAKRARFAEALKGGGANSTLGDIYYDYAKPMPFLSAGGGLSSTAEDYLRFVLMLEGGGQYKGVRIIKTATLERMRQDETTPEIQKAGLFFPGPGMGFGLGFSLVKGPPQPAGAGTFSWWGIAGTEFWVDPTNDVFMVFMVQSAERAMEYQRKNRKWIYDALVK
jgi:CubicO group peptidase (beta-lactamase class C family)